MIRTRDAFIFLVVVLGLGVAILLHVLLTRDTFLKTANLLLQSDTTIVSEFTVDTVKVEKNRSDTISRLRSLIARGETTITPSPSVESEVAIPAQVSTSTESEDAATLLACGGDDSATVKAMWPAGVTVSVRKGDRVAEVGVSKQLPILVATTSSTTAQETTTETKQLLVTRAFPVKGGAPICVPGSVVGVTASGGLITNDASFYGEYGSESLIGYARDGFPVYGFYEGEVDVCGGYQHTNGYRYTLTKERDSILNCFYGTPSSFTL